MEQILTKKVPESLDLFQISLKGLGTFSENVIPQDFVPEPEKEESDSFPLDSELSSDSSEDSESPIPAPVAAESKKAYGSHIMVDQIKIKNEPKLLAEAVRTMIMRNDEGKAT